jgi:outer membrane protein assembly factor BamB
VEIRGACTTPGLLAFNADSGVLAWHAAIGKESYSSPQLVTLDGKEQALYLSDTQLVSFDTATGDQLWSYKNPGSGRPTVQPQLIGTYQLAISFMPDSGVSLLEVSRSGDADATWSVSEKWNSRNMKPDFSDYVHHDGYLYGFDNDIFCCISLADGRRMWKKGRYGAGQVLLSSEQPVLLVITERGEVVLVTANPEKHEELAKFQAIEGKTWNHPVVSCGKLYVRNAEEMACFDILPVK